MLTLLRDTKVAEMVSLAVLGEDPAGEGGEDPPVGMCPFLCSFFGALLLFSSFFFFGERGEQEIREPRFDDRRPHGFAEECRSGTELGHVYRKPRKSAAAMLQSGRYAAG